jgi:hypothetical protein
MKITTGCTINLKMPSYVLLLVLMRGAIELKLSREY